MFQKDSNITATGNIGHLKVFISAHGVEEFNESLTKATAAAKEFGAALRSIPWFFRLMWYVRDWYRLLMEDDYDLGVNQKPAYLVQPDVIALPTAVRPTRQFYSHAD